MKIWILQTGEPLQIDNGDYRPMRAMNLSSFLNNKGHEVVLWSSSFFHTIKKHRSKDYKNFKINDNLEIKLIPSFGYKRNIGFGRIFDHSQLAFNLKISIDKEPSHPDLIFIGYPPIETSYVMSRWAKKNKIPYILDVKDLWPELFVDYIKNFYLQKLMRYALMPYYMLAQYSIKNATSLVSMSKGHLNKAANIGKRSLTNKDLVFPLSSKNEKLNKKQIDEAISWWREFGINFDNSTYKLCFFGTISNSFNFDPVLSLLKKTKEEQVSLEIIICGDGEMLKELKLKMKGYNNLYFTGWVERPQLNILAQNCIAMITPYKNIDNFTYTIPNKIIDALFLKLPILSPLEGDVKDLIDNYKIGVKYDANKENDLYRAYKILIKDENSISKMKKNCKNLYKKHFTYENVYNSLVHHMESLI